MRIIKLMADYHCNPLWETRDGNYGDVAPESLPISPSLQDDLLAWASEYDETLDMADHTNIGFCSQEDVDNFKTKGEELAHRLQAELGPKYKIVTNIVAGWNKLKRPKL